MAPPGSGVLVTRVVVNSLVRALCALVQHRWVGRALGQRRRSWRRACAVLPCAGLVAWSCQLEGEPGAVGESCNEGGGELCVAEAACVGTIPSCHARCRIGCNDCGPQGGECEARVNDQTNEQTFACQFTRNSPNSIRPGQIGDFCNRNQDVTSCVSGGLCVNDVCFVQCSSDADCGGDSGACVDNSARLLPSFCEHPAPPPNWRRPGPACQTGAGSAGQSPGGTGSGSYAGQVGCRTLLSRQQAITCPAMPGATATPITPTACPASPTNGTGAKPPAFTCGDPCIRDTYVDGALQYCWAAECAAGFGMATQSADLVQAANTELGKAFDLCSNAPVLGTPIKCPTLEIVSCEPPDRAILNR